MQTLHRIAGIFAIVLALTITGCETGPSTLDQLNPELSLTATDDELLVGETTTIFAETANLLGRDVQIEWYSTLGQLEPVNNGRMARFTSDVPGTAVVTAEMMVDGQVLRENINVTVNALR